MESEDKVSSEVHCFSKRIDGKTSCGECTDVENKSGDYHVNNISCVEEDSKLPLTYECILGANGEVVLLDSVNESVISRFEFNVPKKLSNEKVDLSTAEVDEEGDLIVSRKQSEEEKVILIEQQLSSSLDLVGEQLWKGAFYLSDYILENHGLFTNSILELASGVGLTSIVASMIAKKVVITDVNRGSIFNIIEENLKRNSDLITAKVLVREIDFFKPENIEQKDVSDVNVILAADVVYNNTLTDAFMRTVLKLFEMQPDKVMYISLEKRFVFTLADLDTVAPCYEYFLVCLDWLQKQNDILTWNVELIDGNFPQRFTYERSRHLVLWKISAMRK